MEQTINFFLIKDNGTIPLRIKDPQNVILLLRKTGLAETETGTYYYRELRIKNESISIFVSSEIK
ncbi:hypothetical protein ACE38V_16135 [Cytobacillus sp. Hz8]|uniref:hypothetical protein n=1 Tax=Cytobacillus sp. Hz8 TaxID=3347168 RepID=UPI0035E29A04